MDQVATLYEQLGGEPVLALVVEAFYARVLANARLAAYFAHTPVEELKHHQREFLSVLLRRKGTYTGRSLREAHAGRGISDTDFDRVEQHLAEALADAGVDSDLVAKVLALVEPLRAEVVGG